MKLFSKVTFIILLCFTSLHEVSAQEQPASRSAAQAETKRLTALLHKLEGTYQIQIINSREKTEFPMVLLDTIVAKRHQSQAVYFQMKPNVRIMILPQSIITTPGFVPIERIKYISANNNK